MPERPPPWINPYQRNPYTETIFSLAGNAQLQARRARRASGDRDVADEWRIVEAPTPGWWMLEGRQWADRLLAAGLIDLTNEPHSTWSTVFVTPAGAALEHAWEAHPFTVLDDTMFDVTRLNRDTHGDRYGVKVQATHPGSDNPTEIVISLRDDDSLGVQVDTPVDRAENAHGPIGYVVTFNEHDLYRNPIDSAAEAE